MQRDQVGPGEASLFTLSQPREKISLFRGRRTGPLRPQRAHLLISRTPPIARRVVSCAATGRRLGALSAGDSRIPGEQAFAFVAE